MARTILLAPCLRGLLEQPSYRGVAQALPGLGDGALADERGLVGQHQFQTVHHFAD